VYDAAVAAGVARFQERHGLVADSVLGPGTAAAINAPMSRRLRQLELALERIRWLPALDKGPFVVVNVPGFQLYAFDTLGVTGEPSLTMNVVVGKAEVSRQTPLFERDMEYIVFRPYWVIPPGILRRETLPAVRRDPGYLARHDMEIYSGSGDTGPALPTTSANLARVSRGELGIRRRPGPQNDLGLAKFIFPNDHNVYMHGTPATALFSRARRDFSHGCIRLEDPARFAVWTMRDPNKWSLEQVQSVMNGSRSERVDLARPIPVTVLYTTAVVHPDGVVSFYDDVYGHDARLERVLEKGYPFAP
jgi:murein L,D-transpeptidase YcbB/YkuD